jgi:hypothetical protein
MECGKVSKDRGATYPSLRLLAKDKPLTVILLFRALYVPYTACVVNLFFQDSFQVL